jgi:hypothetical protein
LSLLLNKFLWDFGPSRADANGLFLFTGSVKIKVNKPEVMNTEIVVEIVVAFEVNTYFCKHVIERLIQ